MNQFTIRDIENLCGIRAHTLRSWEQRCKLFVAKRKQSRHRVYDNEDLKELLRISYLYHQGYKVSELARLETTEILETITRHHPAAGEEDWFIHQLTEAAIDLDRERFDKTVNTVVIRAGLEKAIFSVFYPFLRRIGLLWMTNHIIPAQEHLCSHIIRKKIICSIDGLDKNYGGSPRVLIFAPAGEQHEIPLLVADYLLKKARIQTVYFGMGIPLPDLCGYLERCTVDFIFTHTLTGLKATNLQTYLSTLHRKFPGIRIAAGGPATGCAGKPCPPAELLGAPETLVQYIREHINSYA